jgi:hypothetical protein
LVEKLEALMRRYRADFNIASNLIGHGFVKKGTTLQLAEKPALEGFVKGHDSTGMWKKGFRKAL